MPVDKPSPFVGSLEDIRQLESAVPCTLAALLLKGRTALPHKYGNPRTVEPHLGYGRGEGALDRYTAIDVVGRRFVIEPVA